ncbi:MAG: BCD family MFS transporter [Pseudomonadota bacterium]
MTSSSAHPGSGPPIPPTTTGSPTTASATAAQPGQPPALAFWMSLSTRFLPFADAATKDLPLSRILRLSLFQISVGMAAVLLTGTLNRVMIVELSIPSWIVALLVAVPVMAAPFRALMGHRSDVHISVLGWRRTPFIWTGTMLMFGGLAIMPFALIVLSGDAGAPENLGKAAAAAAFLLTGTGMHMTQTAGLALATDLADENVRPRIVALLYIMLLIGMAVSALVFGVLLTGFTYQALIGVIQGSAVAALIFNIIALWKQEPRQTAAMRAAQSTKDAPALSFRQSWANFTGTRETRRLLITVALGSAAFSMQDVLLEPYGGEILALSVAQTTLLTAIFSLGMLAGFALAAQRLMRGREPHRLAAWGILVGVFGFSTVIFADPFHSAIMFRVGVCLIGLGAGLFSVCTLTAVMGVAAQTDSGIALGAWGAVQATAAGVAIAAGGMIADFFGGLAAQGALGPALTMPSTGYGIVYHIEILLLFATLAAIGPLAVHSPPPTDDDATTRQHKFGLAAFPG